MVARPSCLRTSELTAGAFGGSASIATPTRVLPSGVFYAVDAGPRNLVLLDERVHYVFGASDRGQRWQSFGESFAPQPPFVSRFVFGDAHRIDLTADSFIVFGANDSGQLGLGHDVDTTGASLARDEPEA
jgi:hypothetical protein